MKVSVIGLGWIGLPLARHLKEAGYYVIGSSTSIAKMELNQQEELDTVLFELAPYPKGNSFSKLFKSDILVINIPPRTRSMGDDFYPEQLKFLKSLIDQSSIKKVILVSSTGVYPNQTRLSPYQEDELVTQQNTGNPSQLRGEQVLANERKYEFTVVRLGGLLGDERIPGRYFSGKENVTGHTKVNFIHRIDAVKLLAWVITENHWNSVFNGVAPIHPARRAVYEQNSKDLSITPPLSYAQETQGHDRLISSSKILEMGFRFTFENPLSFSYKS